MKRIRHLFVITLALVLLLPATALAGPVREYQLQYDPMGEAGGALMIVSALVDPQLPLPVTISVPVPRGATVLWAGEVLGGDPASDPTRTTTVEQVGDMDVYTLTMEQAYTAQFELRLQAPTVSADAVSSAVTWTNPGDEVLVNASVITEAGAGDVTTTPKLAGAIQTNDAGQSLYPLEGRQVPTGEPFTIEVTWKRAQAGAAAGGDAAGSSPVLAVVLFLLVAAIAALVVVVARERTRARRAAAVGEGPGATKRSSAEDEPAPAADEDAVTPDEDDDDLTWS